MGDSKQWRDATSYAQGERGVKSPTIWELDLDGLRVSVHRIHGVTDPLWFVTCHPMGIDRHQLDSPYLPTACSEALAYLIQRAERWSYKLGAARVDVEAPRG